MLVNFCDSCLRSDVTTSTVSTEGYEVSNLVNNSDKGFLAYSAIKPPVAIDFVFICNIQISYVIVWPQIGAQKSCGFQLSVKSADTVDQPFTDVSTAFIQKEESGVLFYRRDLSPCQEISVPPNFVQRYIKALNITNYVNKLRLSILKTENSVPALGRIEIWGKVSPRCSKDISMNVMALWMNRFNRLIVPESKSKAPVEAHDKEKERREHINSNIPEEFIDPITCEIMTQPIILPSGKIIDQKTLEKHGQNEAVWGRPVSDPFTGIRFNDIHKPIAALPLKARIDIYLLENSNDKQIKKLPRVLGSKGTQNHQNMNVISCAAVPSQTSINDSRDNVNKLKRTLSDVGRNDTKKSFHGHFLPVVSIRNSNSSRHNSAVKLLNTHETNKFVDKDDISRNNAKIQEKFDSSVHVTNTLTCKCCTEKVFYKLPCKHIICRNALLSLERKQCTLCKLEFQSSNIQRIHL